MAEILQILTTNYSGETVDIRVFPRGGVPYSYEQVTLPYNLYDGLFEGDYEVYFPDYNLTYKFTYPQTELPKEDEKCYCYKFQNNSLTKKRASLSIINCQGIVEKLKINGGSSIFKCVKSGQYTADTFVNIESVSNCTTGSACPPKVQSQECVCYKITGNQYEPYGSFTYLDCNTKQPITQDFVYLGDTWYFQAIRGSVGTKNISSKPFAITPNTGTTVVNNITVPQIECGGPCDDNIITNPSFDNNLNGWSLEDLNGNPLTPEQSWKYSEVIYGGGANYVGGINSGCLVQDCLVEGNEYYISFDLQMLQLPKCGGNAYIKIYAGNNYSVNIVQPGRQRFSTTITCQGGTKLKILAYSSCLDKLKPISVTNVCVKLLSVLGGGKLPCRCYTVVNMNTNLQGGIYEYNQPPTNLPQVIGISYITCTENPQQISRQLQIGYFFDDTSLSQYEYYPLQETFCAVAGSIVPTNVNFDQFLFVTDNGPCQLIDFNYYSCAREEFKCAYSPNIYFNVISNGFFRYNIDGWTAFGGAANTQWSWTEEYGGALVYGGQDGAASIMYSDVLQTEVEYQITMEVWFPPYSYFIVSGQEPSSGLDNLVRGIRIGLGTNFSEPFIANIFGGYMMIDFTMTCSGGNDFIIIPIASSDDGFGYQVPGILDPSIFIQNVCVRPACINPTQGFPGCQTFFISRDNSNIWIYNLNLNSATLLDLPDNNESYRDITVTLNPDGSGRIYVLRNSTQSYNAIIDNLKYWDVDFSQPSCIIEPSFITLPTPPFGQYTSSALFEGLGSSVDGSKIYYSQGRWFNTSPWLCAVVMYDVITGISIPLIEYPIGQTVQGDILRSTNKLWVIVAKSISSGNQIFLQQFTCDDTLDGTTLDGELFLWNLSQSNSAFTTEIFIENGVFYVVQNSSTGSKIYNVDTQGDLTVEINNTNLGNLRGASTYGSCNDSFLGFDFVDPRCRPLLVFGPYPVQQVNQPNVTVTTYQFDTNVADPVLVLNLPAGTTAVNFPGSDVNIAHTLNYTTNTGKMWVLHRQTSNSQVIDEWDLLFTLGIGFTTTYVRRITIPSNIILGFGLCVRDNNTLIASTIPASNNLANANNPAQIVQIDISQTSSFTLSSTNITNMFPLPLAGASFNTTNGVVNIPQNTNTIFNKVIVWGDMVLTDNNQLIIKAKWNANPSQPNNNQLLLQYNYVQNNTNQPNFVHWYGTSNSYNNIKNSITIYNERLWMVKQTSQIDSGGFTVQQLDLTTGDGSSVEVFAGVIPTGRRGPHSASSPRLIPSTTTNPCTTVDLVPNVLPPPPLCCPLFLFILPTNAEVSTLPIFRIARWNFDTNELIELNVPNVPTYSSNYRTRDIAHNLITNTQNLVDGLLWVSLSASTNSSEIWEWKIAGNNNSYNLIFNRIITVPYLLGQGLAYASTNNLISTSKNYTNQRLILVNITSNSVSSTITELSGGFLPQTSSYETRDIMVTTTGQMIHRPSTQIISWNFFNNPTPAILCYQKSTQGANGGIAVSDGGFFQIGNNIIYWVSSDQSYFSIPNTQPYIADEFVHAQFVGNIPIIDNQFSVIAGASSLISCNTSSMDCE